MEAPPCSIWCITSWWILSPCSLGCGQGGSAPQIHQDLFLRGCMSSPPALPCSCSRGHSTRTRFEPPKVREVPSPISGEASLEMPPSLQPPCPVPMGSRLRSRPISSGSSSPGTSNAEAEPPGCCGWMGWEPSASQHHACGICSRKIASPRGMS